MVDEASELEGGAVGLENPPQIEAEAPDPDLTRRLMRSVSSRAAWWDSRTLPRSKSTPRSGPDEAVDEVGELEGGAVGLDRPQIEADENRSAIEAGPDPDLMRTGVLVLVPPSLSPTCSCAKNRCCS